MQWQADDCHSDMWYSRFPFPRGLWLRVVFHGSVHAFGPVEYLHGTRWWEWARVINTRMVSHSHSSNKRGKSTNGSAKTWTFFGVACLCQPYAYRWNQILKKVRHRRMNPILFTICCAHLATAPSNQIATSGLHSRRNKCFTFTTMPLYNFTQNKPQNRL
jgi:hypothetical protein